MGILDAGVINAQLRLDGRIVGRMATVWGTFWLGYFVVQVGLVRSKRSPALVNEGADVQVDVGFRE